MESLHVSKKVDPTTWNENVRRLDGCCFHTWEWCRYSSEKNKTKPLFFQLLAAGALPKAIAVGFTSVRRFGGIPIHKRLSFGSLPAAVDAASRQTFGAALISYGQHHRYTILGTNSFGTPIAEPFLSGRGYSCHRRYEFLVNLTSTNEALWEKIHSKKRNLIRKGMKAGLTIRRGTHLEEVMIYRELAAETLKRKTDRGIVFPAVDEASHYKLMKSRLIDSGLGRLYLAYNGDTPVAGAFFAGYNRQAYYLLSAANKEGLGLAAPDLILWTCMTDYQQEGYRLFNLGGLSEAELNGQPLEKSGLYHFKKRFSSDVYPCYKGQLVLRPFTNTVNTALKKMSTIWKIRWH
jgi:hypothetical protein